MTKHRKKVHHTWKECAVISKTEFIEALSDWCETRADEPVTARGIDRMLGIERVRR
jgi:hypothetical protein